jgi:hypothetical protein
MGLAMTACSSDEKSENYGEAYDVDYMSTDYVDQLLRDGAQTLVGTIEISGADDNYTVAVAEKKVVPNKNYDEGYYIADKNMTGTYPLGSDMGILVMEDGRIVGRGTHEELLRTCELYKEIAMSQLSEEELGKGVA